jgi:hypothetical protein
MGTGWSLGGIYRTRFFSGKQRKEIRSADGSPRYEFFRPDERNACVAEIQDFTIIKSEGNR